MLKLNELTGDPVTGELHRRHHITPEGFYKGKPVIVKADKDDNETE